MLIALRARHIQDMPVLADIPVLLAEDDQAGLHALGALLRSGIERGERLWITAMDPAALEALEDLTGPGIVHRIGTADDPGPQVPVAVRPVELAAALAGHDGSFPHGSALLRSTLIDADTVLVPRRQAARLHDAQVPVRPRSAFSRLLRDPRSLAYLVVFAYSSLRVLPVMFVKQFHGSLWVLWTMDIVTAVPYTWGVIAAITGGRWWIRVAGMVVTIVTFVAPYIYFWLHGRAYPPGVTGIVIGMILLGLLLEVGKQIRTARLNRELRRAPAADAPGSSARG